MRVLKVCVAVAPIALLACLGCGPIFSRMSFSILNTGPNGSETPDTIGVPFQRVRIPSDERTLDGYFVWAASGCRQAPALLIFHGAGETISQWVSAQAFLREHCVSSIVFDYTGSGDSPRPGTIHAVNEDTVAAYAFARQVLGESAHLFVLGHSMGNGPMLEAFPKFSPPPQGVIIGNAFSSLGASTKAHVGWFLRLLVSLSPDWWDNVEAVRSVNVPVLVVHSDTDAVNPIEDGRTIYQAASEPKSISILPGLKHNALRQPDGGWWEAPLRFLEPSSAALDAVSPAP